jgi:hypothetical protein
MLAVVVVGRSAAQMLFLLSRAQQMGEMIPFHGDSLQAVSPQMLANYTPEPYYIQLSKAKKSTRVHAPTKKSV